MYERDLVHRVDSELEGSKAEFRTKIVSAVNNANSCILGENR